MFNMAGDGRLSWIRGSSRLSRVRVDVSLPNVGPVGVGLGVDSWVQEL